MRVKNKNKERLTEKTYTATLQSIELPRLSAGPFIEMRVSKKKINPHLEQQLFAMLYQVVADTKTRNEAKTIFGDLLSPDELTVLAKRLGIAYWINRGRTPLNIKTNLKVSSATVAEIGRRIKNSKGFKMALGKIEAEEWATKWAERIRKLIK